MTPSLASARAAALPALALALLLAGCGGTTPAGSDDASPRPTGSSTSEPATDVPGEPGDDGPEGEDGAEGDGAGDDGDAAPPAPAVDACGLTDDDYAIIRDGLQTADHSAIGGYLAPSVYVTYAASEYEGAVTGNPGLVLQNLQDVSYPGVSWTFDIPAGDLAAWSASPYYAEDFTDCAIVGITSADRGVSLTVSGGQIVREMITFSVEAWGY